MADAGGFNRRVPIAIGSGGAQRYYERKHLGTPVLGPVWVADAGGFNR